MSTTHREGEVGRGRDAQRRGGCVVEVAGELGRLPLRARSVRHSCSQRVEGRGREAESGAARWGEGQPSRLASLSLSPHRLAQAACSTATRLRTATARPRRRPPLRIRLLLLLPVPRPHSPRPSLSRPTRLPARGRAPRPHTPPGSRTARATAPPPRSRAHPPLLSSARRALASASVLPRFRPATMKECGRTCRTRSCRSSSRTSRGGAARQWRRRRRRRRREARSTRAGAAVEMGGQASRVERRDSTVRRLLCLPARRRALADEKQPSPPHPAPSPSLLRSCSPPRYGSPSTCANDCATFSVQIHPSRRTVS